jgi:hypothetical protein
MDLPNVPIALPMQRLVPSKQGLKQVTRINKTSPD